MAKEDLKNVRPPYFDIDPDTALAGLGTPVDTVLLASLAQDCTSGEDAPGSGQRRPRLFSTWEITRYLIPVAPAHLRRVLKQNPELPQGQSDTDGGAKWFTLHEVGQIRAHFATQGSSAKQYTPYRPQAQAAKIVTLANSQAGSGKTTSVAHLAMSAALDGYRVLVVDLDGQGNLTALFGGKVRDQWHTALGLVARHYGQHLRRENQRRLERGEAPQPLDEALVRALDMQDSAVITKTHWPNIDLIGAGPDLHRSALLIADWQMGAPGWKPWQALGQAPGQALAGLAQGYDLVFIDTPPALGALSLSAVAAADILLVPLRATAGDFAATGRFFDMLQASFRSIEERENMAARALGRAEFRFEWAAVRALITRFDAPRQGAFRALMQARLGQGLLASAQGLTGLIGGDGPDDGGVQAVYEVDYRDSNREIYAGARESFDAVYGEFKQLLAGIWRREEQG